MLPVHRQCERKRRRRPALKPLSASLAGSNQSTLYRSANFAICGTAARYSLLRRLSMPSGWSKSGDSPPLCEALTLE